MIDSTIIDSSAIVAALDRREQWHKWTVEKLSLITSPLLTCEAVIAEACFLMKNLHDGEQDVLSLVSSGLVQIDFSLSAEIAGIKALMRKYENVPMSFADACLVKMSELRAPAKVFTLDSDFWVYRKNGTEQIPLIIPPS